MNLNERLNSFKALEKNWDSYNADPIDHVCIDKAQKILEQLKNYAQVFPSPDGGITLEWDHFVIWIDPKNPDWGNWSYYERE